MIYPDHALETIRILQQLIPVVIPTLILVVQESSISWDLYTLVQNLPSESGNGRHIFPDGSEKSRRLLVLRRETVHFALAAFVFLVYLMVVIFAPVMLLDAFQLRIAYTCLLGMPLVLALFDTVKCMSGLRKRHASRDELGRPQVIFRDACSLPLWLNVILFIACTTISLTAFWPSPLQPVAISVMYYSALRFVIGRGSVSNLKLAMKKTLMSSAILGLSFIWSLVDGLRNEDPDDLPLSILSRSDPTAVEWTSLIVSILLSLSVVHTIGLLYRFGRGVSRLDVEDDLRLSGGDAHIQPLRTSRTCRALVEPYALVAFIVLSLSFVATAVLTEAGFVECTFENVVPMTIFFGLPAVMLSALIQAALRGQLKDLCTYEEDWSSIPEVERRTAIEAVGVESKAINSDKTWTNRL